MYDTDEARWTAVRTKDPHADGHFFYCVKTTKIYCRPTCRARLARRSNVEYFKTGPEAVSAGYRACKRCKPELDAYVPEADQNIAKVRRLLENLPEHAPLPKLEDLASDAGLTKYHFHRCFKKATGLTPREYALSKRRLRYPPTSSTNAVTTGDSNISTPSLDPDVTLSPDTNDAFDATQTPDFDLGGWDLEGVNDPFLYDDSIFRFGSADDNLNPDISNAELHDMFLKDVGNTPSSIPVYFSTVETTHGALLMAFVDGQVCKMELTTSVMEAMASLQAAFPAPSFVLIPAEQLEAQQRNPLLQQVNAIVAALEHPVGKVMNSNEATSMEK